MAKHVRKHFQNCSQAFALTPEVVRSGFRGTGIVPLSRDHVFSKLPAATDLEPEVVDRDSCQTIKCTHCGHDMPATPVLKTRLTSVFATVLQVNAHRPKLGKRNNPKIRVEGDVIT